MSEHRWNRTAFKPWACLDCSFITSNLRHIENGHCKHDWSKTVNEWNCCARCGIVQNDNNTEQPCIGTVRVELRQQSDEINIVRPSECRMCQAKDQRIAALTADLTTANDQITRAIEELDRGNSNYAKAILKGVVWPK